MILFSDLASIFLQFQAYAKANPILAGAVSLWGLGVLTFLCRHIPSKIFAFLKRQCTTSLEFTNTDMGSNLKTYNSFMDWFQKHSHSRFSRTMSLNPTWSDEKRSGVLGMGDGAHFFTYRHRFCWLNREQMSPAAGQSQIFYKIQITILGRSRKVLEKLVDEFIFKPVDSDIGIYMFESYAWDRIADVPKRDLSTVIVPGKIKETIIEIIDNFQTSRGWYENRGLAYKKTIILHGVPGTGKTSLIKAVASYYSKNICSISINTVTDSNFAKILNSTPKDSIIVIEDFDSSSATETRTTKKKEVSISAPKLSIGTLLNALEGIVSLDNKLIFLTTNCLDKIDPALVRKGRVDHIFEWGLLGRDEIIEYTKLMFPDRHSYKGMIKKDVKPILGCDLQALYFEHKDHLDQFACAVNERK